MNENDIQKNRQVNQERLARLSPYASGYDIDKFMVDLVMYFDGEVDFNLEKMRQMAEEPGRLDRLIQTARHKNTHPVVEFVQNLFKNLAT